MKKILLIRLSSLGDVVFNLPLANVLKKNGYEVTWAVSEKGINIIKGNPAVDDAIQIRYSSRYWHSDVQYNGSILCKF